VDHPIVRRAPLALSTLSKYPLLMHETGSGTRAVTEDALSKRNVAIKPAMTLASTEALKQTVATGIGVAILSAQTVRAEVEARHLTVVPLKDARLIRPLYRVQLRSASPSPALQAFLEILSTHY